MGKSTPPGADRAAELIDEIGSASRVLWRSQARQAALMVQFCDARKAADKHAIADSRATGGDPMFKAGEFAAGEVSLAVKTSKFIAQRTIAMTRRVQSEAPNVWDAWEHGDIDNDKVVRVNRALRRLVHDRSKKLLNTLVVPVAIEKTPEILGRWLNQFIAEVEPDETDERLRRSFDDRYVSVRPDIDGISFLHAALSSVDAVAVDQILNALAGIAEPGDERTKQQRRADALVDLLCGRISNGCHTDNDTNFDTNTDTGFDTNTDTDDHLDDDPPAGGRAGEADDAGSANPAAAGGRQPEPADDESGSADDEPSHVHGEPGPADDEPGPAEDVSCPAEGESDPADGENGAANCELAGGVEPDRAGDAQTCPPVPAGSNVVIADLRGDFSVLDLSDTLTTADEPWDADDWDLPATAFRPDPHAPPPDPDQHEPGDTDTDPAPEPAPVPARISTPPPAVQPRPPAVTIGVVVTAQSLFGYSNMPGQLIDRSSLVPADTIRDLAQQPGTLFYRLLTDDTGKLLDVTEMGRFPSRRLGMAVAFRDGTCGHPGCHRPAIGCDLDHLTPVPQGPTSAANIGPKCRHDHRCKTHAGHRTTRNGDVTEWTTPTGHTYVTRDIPFQVEQQLGTDWTEVTDAIKSG